MTRDECRRLVERCADNGALTKWEENFIVSLTDKLDRGQPLSEREEEKLDEIHAKVFA